MRPKKIVKKRAVCSWSMKTREVIHLPLILLYSSKKEAGTEINEIKGSHISAKEIERRLPTNNFLELGGWETPIVSLQARMCLSKASLGCGNPAAVFIFSQSKEGIH